MLENNPTVGLHFLDSGSFSILTKAKEYSKKNKVGQFAYYDTKEFYAYMDSYAEFVKKHKVAIDLFANVDVIPNAELTWRNQEYIETKHDIRPTPVIHGGSDYKWVEHYIQRGYDLIALGGMVGVGQGGFQSWLDGAFEVICNTPNGLPRIKTHGFGVTNYTLMWRYPWWSVDSATWTKVGANGSILVPHKRAGKFSFMEHPYVISVSMASPDTKEMGKHYTTLSSLERSIVLEWLKEIEVSLGVCDPNELEEKKNRKGKVVLVPKTLEPGVINRHSERKIANLLFFERLRACLPAYPCPYLSKKKNKTVSIFSKGK